MRTINRSDDRPRLTGRAVLVGGIIALRPPFRLVDDAVFDRGHARGVDVARRPGSRALGDGAADGGPRRSGGAVVERRIGALRPPIGFLGNMGRQ